MRVGSQSRGAQCHHAEICLGMRAKDVAGAIVEYCIQPRCLLSPMDADYCAEIITYLHKEGTPGFWTINVYNHVRFSSLRPLLMTNIPSDFRSTPGQGHILLQRE